jgi:hypothetical protein
VLGIDTETCPTCGGAVRIIACIEDPVVIEKILTYLDAEGAECEATRRPAVRAPPQRGLFDKTARRHENPAWAVLPAARQRRWRAACTENDLDDFRRPTQLAGFRASNGV